MELSVYRVAYEAANAEFRDILKKFEQVSLRKDQFEKVVEALRPLAGLDGQSTATEQRAENHAREQVQQVVEPPSEPVQQSADLSLDLTQQDEDLVPEAVQQNEALSSDPIQQRIDSALKHRSAFRGMREYCHGFGAGM